MDVLDIIIEVLEWVLKLLTAYTALTAVCFLLPRKKWKEQPAKTRFAVLIPARNESKVIGALVASLHKQNYPPELYDIIVIPNNCTDDTEQQARLAGAQILTCTDPVKTKGDVLHQIFAQIMGQYDAYCVFDADNVVDADFLARMNDVVVAGGQAAKSRQCALNPYDNWVAGCYDLYFQNHNLLFSRPRTVLPLSAKLIGTGFMVTDELMQKLGGWNTVTLTEDIELAVQCSKLGVRVHYVPEALTYDEQPLSFRVSLRQRRRWSAGVQDVAWRYAPRLLTMVPSWLRWDLAIHVSMIHVQMLMFIPVIYGLIGISLPQLANTLVLSGVSFWFSSVAMGLFLSLTAGRSLKKQWKAVLMYPVFLLSWYPLHFWALVAKPKTWKPIAHGTAVQR